MKMMLNTRTASILSIVALFLASIVFDACAKKINFTTSLVEPAAVGKVKVKKDNNNNYAISVSITHLASPKKLNPPKDIYVVWIETAGHGIKNIGMITSSSGFLSKTLKGSLRAVTSFKPIKVFITAETEGDIPHPGIPVVLTTEGF
jgi:hypothetical protein